MLRVFSGEDATLTYDVGASGETHTARFVDAKNRYLNATVSVSGTSATVTVTNSQWADGSSGHGRVEIMKDVGGVKTIVKSERVRIMPGLEADYLGGGNDYGR